MKKIICSVMLAASGFAFSQSILNAKSPEEFRKIREQEMMKTASGGDTSTHIEPLKYGFIDDKDILKSMVVWEIIDLNDKINQPLYHSSDGLVSQTKSLYQLLLDGINSGKITEVYDDENFTTKLSPSQIAARTHSEKVSDWLVDKINSGEKITEADKRAGTDRYETKSENVKLIKIKGMWYIDRRDSQMKYRLLGIAAMGQDPATMGQFGPDGRPLYDANELIDLFWIWYPDARDILANAVVYNNKNLSSNLSYDDILNARRFSTIIYKSEGSEGNGTIADYIPANADEQLEESDRIKDRILLMENEMWNY